MILRGFDRFAVFDWSGGNDTGPKPRKDAIWMAEGDRNKINVPVYLRNRVEAESALINLIENALAAGQTLCIGFDFPFGFPKGFAHRLTGTHDPFAVWDWIERHIQDTPRANNRFDLAGKINGVFPGTGPFWFNGLKRDIEGLPRKDTRAGHGMAEHRRADATAKGAFALWQMGGAGAVGGQVFTGLPLLNHMRRAFPDQIAIWPFERLDRPVTFVEIWPGLINPAVKRAEADGGLRDEEQVRLLTRALSRLPDDDLQAMLSVDATEEGWIMGLGHEDKLTTAAEETATDLLRPPPLRNDCFALPAGVDWTPVDEALDMLSQRLHPVSDLEVIPLNACLGRILSQNVVAKRSNPPLPNTAVDGYGFAHDSLGSGDPVLPLMEGRAAAGPMFEGTVPKGHAIRVLTGAALPRGVDTVILQEDVTVQGGQIAFRSGIKPGANTRCAGEDVVADEVILQAGRTLTPADLALAAAVGISDMSVRKPLRVGVLSTGDELLDSNMAASPGQIYDANRPMLLAMSTQFGYMPIDLGRVRDDRDALRAVLDSAASDVDVILTSGGASAGDEDHVSALLNEEGAMAQWRIALKPGRPLALGMWQNTPVFGLPGNPVAALVCTLIFARPAMQVLAGQDWHLPEGFFLPAAFEKHKKPGRREYLRARVRDGQVEVFKSEGSGRISGLSWAEGLVELPDGALTVTHGTSVRYIPFSSF